MSTAGLEASHHGSRTAATPTKEHVTVYNDYDGAYLAVLLILLPILFLLAVASYVVTAFFLMKVFEKAGVQGKWRAWVPVYNAMVFAKLGDVSPWVMLGAILIPSALSQVPVIGWLLSLASLAVAVAAGWRVGLKLGKEWYLLLLWLVPGLGFIIWLGILAFDSSRWNTAIPASPWAGTSWLTDTTVWQGVPVQSGNTPPAGPGAYPPPPTGYQPPAPPTGYQPPAPPQA